MRALFGPHNPMWSIAPSLQATRALIDFWRTADANGALVHDFADDEWSTRFLGDLYQDLSEQARKSYALVQTPEFIEEFILSYTLDPAIKEFGLEPKPPYGHPELPHCLRVIDPACGSGSFVLGAFHRLLGAWQAARPGADRRELVARALGSVHGVDKNPFAVTITRFRLHGRRDEGRWRRPPGSGNWVSATKYRGGRQPAAWHGRSDCGIWRIFAT